MLLTYFLVCLQTFVVEVIQFRNAFDAQGPAVPGILPEEAVERLQNFQQRYAIYDSKRKTLVSVSRLFGIPIKPFPELDKTGEVSDTVIVVKDIFNDNLRYFDPVSTPGVGLIMLLLGRFKKKKLLNDNNYMNKIKK